MLQAAAECRVERVIHCSTESILLPARGTTLRLIDESKILSEPEMPGPYTRSNTEQNALPWRRQMPGSTS